MSNVYAPFLLLGGSAYANNWLKSGQVTDFKPLLAAGIASMFAGLANGVNPDLGRVISMIGWVAFVGYFVLPSGPGASLLAHIDTIDGTK